MVTSAEPIRTLVILPLFSFSSSNGSGDPSRVTEMSYGSRRAFLALWSASSKKRKMPCLPEPGKSMVSVSVAWRSPSSSTVKSATYVRIVVSSYVAAAVDQS